MTTDPKPDAAALLHPDAARLDELEAMLKACPHAVITWNDDADNENDDGHVPLGYSIRVRGCAELSVSAPTLRQAIDLMKTEPDEDGNVIAFLAAPPADSVSVPLTLPPSKELIECLLGHEINSGGEDQVSRWIYEAAKRYKFIVTLAASKPGEGAT